LKDIWREDTYEYFKEIRDQALRGQACPQIRPAHNLRAVNYGCQSWEIYLYYKMMAFDFILSKI